MIKRYVPCSVYLGKVVSLRIEMFLEVMSRFYCMCGKL